ncbi:RalBP1-associated Eps domain-containing protein isoform 3 [Schistosoma japonicum]|nr:RalBP1-associated Eps domain-containing protein isoform 3 [Schistosoma japonicum]
MNSYLTNFRSVNQNLPFPPSQSNGLPNFNDLSDPTLSLFITHQSPRSVKKPSYDENIADGHSETDSFRSGMPYHSYQLNKWSSFNQQSSTVSVAPSNTTINSSSNLNKSSVQRIGDPWAVTSDQKAYYLSQFLRLQPDIRSKLSGIQSKAFFELSKLPSVELSKIWELSDLDYDGQLTLGEFCIAMHLVVYRLNGVPIPNSLPTALLELVETNWLSAKLTPTSLNTDSSCSTTTNIISDCTSNSFKQQSYVNSILSPENPQVKTASSILTDMSTPTETITTTNSTGLKYHQQQQQQRRWSLSSQSDISSLAEEGMMLFESKLNMNAQLKHPIPVKARTLPSNIIPEMTTPLNSSADNHPNDVLHTYHFPYNINNNAFYPTTESISLSTTIQSSVLFSDQHSNSLVVTPPTTVIKAPPPPPPPRANLLLMTNIDCVDDTGQKYGLSVEEKEAFISSLPTKFNSEEVKLKDSQNSDIIPSLNANVEVLKTQCDHICKINEQLTTTLIKLQKDRIALKIFLERLMPLETI